MTVVSRMTSEARRGQLLRIAAEEFSRTGLHGTSAETIARHANITQPYIFRLFGTKKGLFIKVLEGSFDKIIDAFEESSRGKSGSAALLAAGNGYRTLLSDRNFLLIQLQGFAASADPDIRDTVRRGYGRMWHTLQEASGAEPSTIKRFLALGMMLNAMAAMDLENFDESWAKEFLVPLPLGDYLGMPDLQDDGDEQKH